LEHAWIDALDVVGGLDQIGPRRAAEHRLAYPVRAVLADIPRHFTRPHREADECDASQVQRLQDHVEIGSERVVVVSNRGFARPAEAATVIRDHTVAGLEQRCGLFLPRSPAEWPPMNE